MMRSGTVYQLQNLARTITEIGSGLFATPTVSDSANRAMSVNSRGEPKLSGQAKIYPDGPVEATEKQKEKAKMWPTPTARDYKGCSPGGRFRNGVKQLDTVDRVVNHLDGPGALNPMFVEWLMGYPTGHTDLKD